MNMPPLPLANVLWPALVLSIRLSAWWCIAASLVIEAAALWRFAKVAPIRAFFGSLVANAASAFIGAILIPLAGLNLELLGNTTYNGWFGWGTFNPVTAGLTFIMALAMNAAIELFVLWLVFLLPSTRRLLLVVLAANATTLAMAVASILAFPSN